MDEETLLEWYGAALRLAGRNNGLKLAHTKEGYVAKMGAHASPPSPTVTEAFVALRTMIRGEMTVGR